MLDSGANRTAEERHVVRQTSLSWFVVLLSVGILTGLLIGAIGFTSLRMGFFAGIAFGPPIFALAGLALDRRHMGRREWLLSSTILLVSVFLAAYILWLASGPVKGDLRRIETEDAIVIQRAESCWFFPNRWEAYSVTPKVPGEPNDGTW